MINLSLLCAALAAVASATGYIDGREYEYHYHGQVYTGFPRVKSQYSGYAFSANIIVQPQGESAIFKTKDAKVGQFNGEMETVAEYEPTYKDLPAHAEFLTRPFRVYRKNGIVTHFEVTKDEPMFSVNMKKGLVTLFNLNFESVETEASTEHNDIHKPDLDAHYYKVYEDSMMGDCETSYIIQHHPNFKSPHNNIVLNVTKARDYHKCKSFPNQAYNTFYGYECSESVEDKSHTLHGNVLYRYDIRGNRDHYIIEKVATEGEIAYTPYPLEGQTVATRVNCVLELVDERSSTEQIDMPSDTVSHDKLSYDFEFKRPFDADINMKRPHYLYHILGKKVPISDIRKQVEELIQVYNDPSYKENVASKNYPAKFVELLRSVATLGYDEIGDLYKAYAEIPKDVATSEQKRQRNLFLDVLVNLGTNPAILFGKHLVEDKLVKPQEALYFIQQLPFHVKEISKPLLTVVQEMCDSPAVLKNRNLRIGCVFALSNMVFDQCVARYHPEGRIPMDEYSCSQESALPFFNYIATKLETAEDEDLTIAYMKALGNTGFKQAIPFLRPYVNGDRNPHLYYRSSGLVSLMNVGHYFPDMVREILVPLLVNKSENYELRLTAFYMLMQYRPQMYQLESLARILRDDPDDQVRSFIYSTFKSMANSTHRCDRKISKDVKYALRIMEEGHQEYEDYDYSYSHHHYSAGYEDDFNYGGHTRFSYLASDTGYIPRAVYLGVEDFIGGKSFQTLGVSFKQHGLEKIVDKIFGPEGSFGQRSIFDMLKLRQKRDTTGKELNEIKQKLKLPVRDYEDIHGEIFLKVMGNQLSFYHFNDKTFESFFKEGRFVIPNLPALYHQMPKFLYQRFMLPVDKMYVHPTEAGLPVMLDYKLPVYYFHENNELSFKVEPGFFPEERGGKYPDNVKLKVDGHFVLDKNLFASMSVVVPFDQVVFGAGISRRSTISLPLKVDADLAVAESKLKMSWTPVPHEILSMKYQPYTFIDSYANSVPRSLEPGYLPVKKVHRYENEKHYFHDALGLGFDVKTDYENDFNDFGSMFEYLMKTDFRQKYYYFYGNPRFEPFDITVNFDYAKQDITRKVNLELKRTIRNEVYESPYFKKEGFEEYEYQRNERFPVGVYILEALLTAEGDKERKIEAELVSTRDLLKTYHKVNFYYDRTPFTKTETQNFKICGSSYLKYPKYDLTKLVTLDTLDMDHTIETEMKIYAGKDCQSDKKIKVQGRYERSEEQEELERKREEKDTPEHYNQYAYHYQQCQKEREHGINYGEHCMAYIQLAATVHKYSHHIKYENLSPEFSNFTYKLSGLLKHMMYYHSDHNLMHVQNPEGEIHIDANFSMHIPIADIRVTKPKSVSHYTHVFLPYYTGLSSYPVLEDILIKNSFNDHFCSVEKDDVHTFDRYEYTLPPIDCYKVIAKDCSPKEYFTVLASKITHPKYAKAIKVFLGNHKIEALPVSDESDLIVRVDGKRVVVTEDEPYVHIENESYEPLFYITHREVYFALHSKKYGLIVEYDGRGVFVQVSPYYRSKLCGLCGNYNGQKYDGYTTEEGCVFDDEKSYAYSYAIPSDTCSVPSVAPKCPPAEGGFGCTRLRNRVIQLNTGKIPQTCFSTEPVAECSPHCKPQNMVKRQLGFHCLPAKDDSTKDLQRQQQERILYEVRRKSRDHEATIDYPENCYTE